MSIKLPSKDSALGRSLTVLGYQVGMIVVAYITSPEFTKTVAEYYPETATVIVLIAPLLSLVRNLLRSDVANT